MIYILLPVHNRRALTEQFVGCLQRQTYRQFKLILIDDGSTDGTSEMVTSMLPDVTVIRGKGSWWWGGSLHQGIRWLAAQRIMDDALVLFINDDLKVADDYLERGVAVMRDRPRSFVLSQFRSADNKPEETGTRVDLGRLHFSVPTDPSQINCLATQGLFAHWAAVRAVGGFHPTLLPHYLSDYEYTIRAHRKGFACETNDTLLIDLNRETTGYHTIEDRRFVPFVKKFFSLKSPANPVFYTTFVFLVCPPLSIVPNLFRVWRHASRTLFQAFLVSMR